MLVEILAALISAGVAVCSAVVTAYMTTRSIRLQHALTVQRTRMERLEASEDLTRRYRSNAVKLRMADFFRISTGDTPVRM